MKAMPARFVAFALFGSLYAVAWAAPPRTPVVEFPKLEEARQIIVDDDAYFDRLQILEMGAKTGRPITGRTPEQRLAECKQRYADATRAFSASEKTAVRWYVARLHPMLAEHYPLLAEKPWSFLKVDDAIEGLMTSSRGNHLILNERIANFMLRYWRQRSARQQGLYRFSRTLVHEQLHILQRQKPELFHPLYEKIWGFKRVGPIQATPWLDRLQLTNPDAMDLTWAMPIGEKDRRTWIWPRLVLAHDAGGPPKMPDDLRMIAIELEEKDGRFTVKLEYRDEPVYKPLKDIPGYMERFPIADLVYHPDEITADLFGEMFALDHFDTPGLPQPDRRLLLERTVGPLRDWCRENLK